MSSFENRSTGVLNVNTIIVNMRYCETGSANKRASYLPALEDDGRLGNASLHALLLYNRMLLLQQQQQQQLLLLRKCQLVSWYFGGFSSSVLIVREYDIYIYRLNDQDYRDGDEETRIFSSY